MIKDKIKDKSDGNKRKGTASFSPEKRAKMLEKSLETRRRKKAEKELSAESASKLRKKAQELRSQAEKLEQEADEMDGQKSSDKYRKKYESELSEKITEVFGGTVSPQYMKQMIAHAILRKKSVDEIVTPTMYHMDILIDPETSVPDKKEAARILTTLQSAKPAIVEDQVEVLGSVQAEFDNLEKKRINSAPKR